MSCWLAKQEADRCAELAPSVATHPKPRGLQSAASLENVHMLQPGLDKACGRDGQHGQARKGPRSLNEPNPVCTRAFLCMHPALHCNTMRRSFSFRKLPLQTLGKQPSFRTLVPQSRQALHRHTCCSSLPACSFMRNQAPECFPDRLGLTHVAML